MGTYGQLKKNICVIPPGVLKLYASIEGGRITSRPYICVCSHKCISV